MMFHFFFFSFSDLFFIVERIISIETTNNIGITALRKGISGSLMGIDAISEIKRVETNSDTSISPICLLPIIFRETESKRYIIIVLISIDVTKTTSFLKLLYKSCTIIQKMSKKLKNPLDNLRRM